MNFELVRRELSDVLVPRFPPFLPRHFIILLSFSPCLRHLFLARLFLLPHLFLFLSSFLFAWHQPLPRSLGLFPLSLFLVHVIGSTSTAFRVIIETSGQVSDKDTQQMVGLKIETTDDHIVTTM
jgi:hypothetical protein